MTAQEFIDAVKAGGTVEVDSDIDFNEYIFTQSNNITMSGETTINGNGHTLLNLQQGTGNRIFTFTNTNNIINNLKIRNVNCPSIPLFYHSGSTTSHNVLNECEISGYIYELFEQNYSYNYLDVTKCSLNINRFVGFRGNLIDCYIVFNNYIGATIDQIYLGGSMRNCYVKGEIAITRNSSIPTTFRNTCFNLKITGGYSVNMNSALQPISVVNKDKIEGALTTTTYIVPVTDEQMHSAQELFDVGFNIYVPDMG